MPRYLSQSRCLSVLFGVKKCRNCRQIVVSPITVHVRTKSQMDGKHGARQVDVEFGGNANAPQNLSAAHQGNRFEH